MGSGTAGSIIAHRLATETNYSFLVIEAGGRSNFLYEIPVLGPMLHGSLYDWKYQTVPQENACLAMNNKVGFTKVAHLIFTKLHILIIILRN